MKKGGLEKFAYLRQERQVKTAGYLTDLLWLHNEIGTGGLATGQMLVRVTRDRILWRDMTTHVLKGHNTRSKMTTGNPFVSLFPIKRRICHYFYLNLLYVNRWCADSWSYFSLLEAFKLLVTNSIMIQKYTFRKSLKLNV